MKKITISVSALIFMLIAGSTISQTSLDNKDKDNSSVPSIDGKISSDEWKGAKIFTDFYVVSPKSDEKYYDSTIVYVKQTKDAMYFAFKWWPKGKVICQSLNRDISTDEENEFFIILDLENKNKNGYFFATSFMNNQRDALIYNERNQSHSWDWIWYNKTTIYKNAKDGKTGYVETEIMIPVDKIQNKNKKQIGFDIQMFAYRTDGTSYFYSVVPTSEVTTVKGTYKWDLTVPFEEKLNLGFNAQPFIVGDKFNNISSRFRYGGEFTVSLDKHKLKSTFHTDESTLEADPFRFSLYGRPIFLQEKRPFFSKDLDIFNTPINLFYTRAIQDIDYGLNYTYRSDKLKLGAVYVQEDTLPGVQGSKRNFFIARPNFNFQDFNIGGLFVYTHDTLGKYSEKVASVDTKINLPLRFRLLGQFARSFNTLGKGGNLYNAYLYYESNNAGGPFCDLSYARYDSTFRSTTLFNNYGNNYDELNLSAGYQFVRKSKTFSNINISGGYYRARRFTDNFDYQNGFFINTYYKIFGWLSAYHGLNYDRPNQFDEAGNITKTDNLLGETNFKLIFGNNSLTAGYYGGKYFGTTLKNPYLTLDMAFFYRIRLILNYIYVEHDVVKQTIYSAKLDYRILPKLYLRTYYQRDTYNKRGLWNTLLQYEFFGGSSVYLVLNLNGDRLQNTGRYFKVSYEFNF
jgi:hypothetical protein